MVYCNFGGLSLQSGHHVDLLVVLMLVVVVMDVAALMTLILIMMMPQLSISCLFASLVGVFL